MKASEDYKTKMKTIKTFKYLSLFQMGLYTGDAIINMVSGYFLNTALEMILIAACYQCYRFFKKAENENITKN